MINGKKLTNYTGETNLPRVPTSVDGILVRSIDENTFSNTIEQAIIDTYKNDITGAPWGARNVLWLKEPKCELHLDPNGGSGTVIDLIVNKNQLYKIPQNSFTAPSGKIFDGWYVNSITSETVLMPDSSWTFNENTILYAKWKATTVTVTYKAGAGSGADVIESASTTELYQLKSTCPFTAPTTQIFKNWMISSTTYDPGASLLLTTDTTVTANYMSASSILKPGTQICKAIKSLFNNKIKYYYTEDNNVTRFIKANADHDGLCISTSDSAVTTKIWADDTTVYWYSTAAYIYCGQSLSNLFYNFKALTDISIQGWNSENTTSFSHMITGSPFITNNSIQNLISSLNITNALDVSYMLNNGMSLSVDCSALDNALTYKGNSIVHNFTAQSVEYSYFMKALPNIKPKWDKQHLAIYDKTDTLVYEDDLPSGTAISLSKLNQLSGLSMQYAATSAARDVIKREIELIDNTLDQEQIYYETEPKEVIVAFDVNEFTWIYTDSLNTWELSRDLNSEALLKQLNIGCYAAVTLENSDISDILGFYQYTNAGDERFGLLYNNSTMVVPADEINSTGNYITYLDDYFKVQNHDSSDPPTIYYYASRESNTNWSNMTKSFRLEPIEEGKFRVLDINDKTIGTSYNNPVYSDEPVTATIVYVAFDVEFCDISDGEQSITYYLLDSANTFDDMLSRQSTKLTNIKLVDYSSAVIGQPSMDNAYYAANNSEMFGFMSNLAGEAILGSYTLEANEYYSPSYQLAFKVIDTIAQSETYHFMMDTFKTFSNAIADAPNIFVKSQTNPNRITLSGYEYSNYFLSQTEWPDIASWVEEGTMLSSSSGINIFYLIEDSDKI